MIRITYEHDTERQKIIDAQCALEDMIRNEQKVLQWLDAKPTETHREVKLFLGAEVCYRGSVWLR